MAVRCVCVGLVVESQSSFELLCIFLKLISTLLHLVFELLPSFGGRKRRLGFRLLFLFPAIQRASKTFVESQDALVGGAFVGEAVRVRKDEACILFEATHTTPEDVSCRHQPKPLRAFCGVGIAQVLMREITPVGSAKSPWGTLTGFHAIMSGALEHLGLATMVQRKDVGGWGMSPKHIFDASLA